MPYHLLPQCVLNFLQQLLAKIVPGILSSDSCVLQGRLKPYLIAEDVFWLDFGNGG